MFIFFLVQEKLCTFQIVDLRRSVIDNFVGETSQLKVSKLHTCPGLAKTMNISQVFPSTRSAFRTYPGCLYPISVLSVYLSLPQDIPPPLRSTRITGRRKGGGRLWEYKFRIPVNSSFTIRTSEREREREREISVRLLWILTPDPLTDRPGRLLRPHACNYRWPGPSKRSSSLLCFESRLFDLIKSNVLSIFVYLQFFFLLANKLFVTSMKQRLSSRSVFWFDNWRFLI